MPIKGGMSDGQSLALLRAAVPLLLLWLFVPVFLFARNETAKPKQLRFLAYFPIGSLLIIEYACGFPAVPKLWWPVVFFLAAVALLWTYFRQGNGTGDFACMLAVTASVCAPVVFTISAAREFEREAPVTSAVGAAPDILQTGLLFAHVSDLHLTGGGATFEGAPGEISSGLISSLMSLRDARAIY